MKKIGITGQNGFIGQHLFNTIGLFPDKFERVFFNKNYFDDARLLDAFVSQCDVIIHLAGMNRSADPQTIYDTNIELTRKLIGSFERTGNKVKHVIFSSSLQEEQDNLYGKSKKDARTALHEWAVARSAIFTGMIIPNVFGPFGKPFYNSVIATFCYQLCNAGKPTVLVDAELKLIYVGELVNEIINLIDTGKHAAMFHIQHTSQLAVSSVLKLLEGYKLDYLQKGNIPVMENLVERNLFNTLRSYQKMGETYPVKLVKHEDMRGSFTEIIRLGCGGQVSFSITLPGITRGNHFHTRKIERFAVIKGVAEMKLRRIGTDKVEHFYLDGHEPSYVDIPVWHVHNIKNTGQEELYTIFWINEAYNSEDPDTYMEQV